MPHTDPSPSTARQRRGRPGYDLDTLLEICVGEFNRHGYDATSIGALAEALNISKSAIYHHVESKEALLSLAVDRALGQLEALLDEVEASPGPSRDQIELLLRRSVHLLVDQMPYVSLLLRLRGNSPVEVAAMERRRHTTRRVEDLMRRAQADGVIRDDLSAKGTTRLVLGMINSMVDWYRPGGSADQDVMADHVVAIVMDGIAPTH